MSAYDFPQRLAKRATRSSSATLALLAISGLAILGLVFVAALWAGKESDAAALDRQRKLVDSRLQDQVDRVSNDLRLMAAGYSSLISASASMSNEDDAGTAQAFATMSKTVFGYNGTFLITPTGDLAFASDPETTRRYKWIRPLLLPMVRTVLHGKEAAAANAPIRVDLMRLEGRPSIAGIASIDAASRTSQPLLLAAFRFLDGPTLDTLSREQGLAGARYARTADAEANEVAFQIEATATHEPIGFIIWTPDLPGSRVVARLTPLLTFAGVLIGGLFFALMVRLRKSLLELAQSEDHARHLSLHDVLTGLPNRALFSERFKHCLDGLRHHGNQALLALIDLDRFKEVNDTYGHPAGDELLIKAVARMQELLGNADTLARVGGDEFALLVPGVSAGRDNELLLQIIKTLSAPFELRAGGGVIVRIGCSIGAVGIVEGTAERGETLRRADVALYEAKSSGRGKYVTYDVSMDSRGSERENLTRELRKVLTEMPSSACNDLRPEDDAGKLELFFQSVHRATRGEPISGAEALVRWRHPRLGLLAPDRFIPLAEEAGLIDQLGEWVLRRAAEEARAWPEMMTVAVNVSPSQLRRRGFDSKVLSIIEETGFDPARLELELTEAALFEVDAAVQSTLGNLRSQGVRIALDDFGTGFSSLSHLLQINIDRIKIDRSFVTLLGSKAEGATIVSSVIALSRKLGKAATAEGVETVGQQDFLIAAGCTDLQGYLYSRPLPCAEFAALMLTPDGRLRGRI
ncbi:MULTISPECIES: putative bifunctional diguanylate cyclase/phosphodiesterase [unclassified Rhizobium]|uniref:putative bifunctional diguanylate cyclase/phosphodiesterase n=1 Tax=Rhizobium sp. BG4 TaxID=2613770 RepID=UPI00193D85EE|nr:EAL domain-containing protein [Rhizobium sp. BG4]QRM47434.1 EAL domain-containing protein [Rhizobium sp. BG4]